MNRILFRTYAEFTCRKCGNKLCSENEDEIMQFIELYDAGRLSCPVCGGKHFEVRVRGNGGRSTSPSPPFSSSLLPPSINEESMERVVDEIIKIARRRKR